MYVQSYGKWYDASLQPEYVVGIKSYTILVDGNLTRIVYGLTLRNKKDESIKFSRRNFDDYYKAEDFRRLVYDHPMIINDWV